MVLVLHDYYNVHPCMNISYHYSIFHTMLLLHQCVIIWHYVAKLTFTGKSKATVTYIHCYKMTMYNTKKFKRSSYVHSYMYSNMYLTTVNIYMYIRMCMYVRMYNFTLYQL